MDELDEQIKLARMGAFEEGATQMEEMADRALCGCTNPMGHAFDCPVSIWDRAAKLMRTLKAAEEAKGDRFEDAEGVAV